MDGIDSSYVLLLNESSTTNEQQHNDYFQQFIYGNISNMTGLVIMEKDRIPEEYELPTTISHIQADNNHIVIPLMSFVFGFPVLVMTVLCIIQERNKWMYERQAAIRLQNARLSTTSTLYAGLHPSKSSVHLKDSFNLVGIDAIANNSNNGSFLNSFNKNGQKNSRQFYNSDHIHIRLKDLKMKSSDDTLEEIDELETESFKIVQPFNEKTSYIIDI